MAVEPHSTRNERNEFRSAFVIPVLDLMDGLVVRGVGGERAAYRPIVSRLVDSAAPLDVATAIRNEYGISELYVADLDAIIQDRPQWDVLRDLSGAGFQLLVDAGLRDTNRAEQLLACGVRRVIAALETSPGPEDLRALVETVTDGRVLFSLDLRQGRPLGDEFPWGRNPLHVAALAYECGIRSMIVLDLAAVGKGTGLLTLDLCRTLKDRFSDLEIITGGGVRSADDLEMLRGADVDGVLVASALHDGQLTTADCNSETGDPQA